MLTHLNNYEGSPPRLYRHPSEIQADMLGIKQKVGEIESMLSVRDFLMELLTRHADKSPEAWIPELEEAVGEARAALDDLKSLNSTLIDLREELGQVRCVMRM